MIQRVVIFGGHIQALGIARQIATKRKEVILLIEDRCQIARFSRTVKHVVVCSKRDKWVGELAKLELPEQGTLLFPTNDEAVEWLCTHYDELKDRFVLGVPEPDIIALFNNKRTAYRYAEKHKVPCPICWYPDTLDDVQKLSGELPYPVVIKPAIMYSFHATFGKKAFRCDDAKQLIATYRRIEAAHYPLNTILIQEFLAGGPKHLYSYGVMAVKGKPIVSIQANRIRQNPMDFGNSTTYAITCNVPMIEEQSLRLLAQTKYFGLGEVEWMWDEKSKQYKFLEINTRAWKWHTLSNMLGFSFVGAMIDYFDGKKQVPKRAVQVQSAQYAWVERLTDWVVSMKEMLAGRMKLRDIIKGYQIPHESAVWSWCDPLPGILYILLSPILYIKRH